MSFARACDPKCGCYYLFVKSRVGSRLLAEHPMASDLAANSEVDLSANSEVSISRVTFNI